MTGNGEQENVDWEHVYVEETVKRLVKRVPELKGIRPAASQDDLDMILKKTGEKVDESLNNLVDLIAREDITQERLSQTGRLIISERVKDSYLIVRHGESRGVRVDEYRMDAKGNRMGEVGLDRGFFVTSGFALSCIHFSPAFWRNTKFRYLGDQRTGGQETYVVAFTQLPGADANLLSMNGPLGNRARMRMQGIAWISKQSFEVLLMRIDLLAPQPDIGLEEQTTIVRLSEVRIADVPNPLWLPREAEVFIKFRPTNAGRRDSLYLNKHRYTDYRQYRVTTKMVVPNQ